MKSVLTESAKATSLVSVIIPSFNHAAYVRETIQSVATQTYENIELIVIDDGSTDESVEVIKEALGGCTARFVRTEFRHRSNKGLSATLNEGLAWCRGEFLACVASDDIWEPEKTTTQVEYLNGNPTCLGVFGVVTQINEHGVMISEYIGSKHEYTFKDIFLHKHDLSAPTQLLRRAAVVGVGGYDERTIIEDWSMWLSLTHQGGTLDYLPIVFARYRRHEGNMSSNSVLMMENREYVLRKYKTNKRYRVARARALIIAANDLRTILPWRSIRCLTEAVLLAPRIIINIGFIGYFAKMVLPESAVIRLRKLFKTLSISLVKGGNHPER